MLNIINPATGKGIHKLKEDTVATVRQKFEKARAAQEDWGKTPLKERMEVIRSFRNLLDSSKETLARTLTSEVGKPITQSRNELNGVLPRIDFFLEQIERVLQDETVFKSQDGKMTERIGHEPLGVIANISGWNYPYFIGSNVFLPALLTGNTVLYKPSEYASLTGLAITDLLLKAGVQKDVFVPLIGGGAIGAQLLKHPLNGIFFTGSYATGKKIAEATASRMIKMQLELGGKDPTYICEDSDIETAAMSTADGAFYNTGQSCCSVERIYVHEKIYANFVDSFLRNVREFVVGDPTDEKTYIGPLTRREQLSVLESQVADALRKGGKLLCGGKRIKRPGFYFEPTVFSNVNHSMRLMKDETFGPMIGIQKVKSEEEAVRLMNDTEYGLTAGVYSRDAERAKNILSRINSGSVYYNCCDRVSPRLPWSGRGHSGTGITLSTYGILTFTQPKAWHWNEPKSL